MRFTAVVLVLLLLASSVATAQSTIANPVDSTPTTLYFHLDAHQDFPINTQPPDDRYAKGSTRGILASTTTCSPDGSPGQVHQDHHTVYGFSTPGYVEYDFEEEGGPRIHPERGLAYDVELDTSAAMTGYWYLKTTVDSDQGTDVNNFPVLVPQVTVQFTMRTGDAVSFGAEAYNAGQVIAQGDSGPIDLYPHEQNAAYEAQEDGSHVYEIPVPMEMLLDTIPADGDDSGYNMRVDVFTNVPGCDDQDSAVMPGSVEIFTAPDYRPRLDLSIRNPLVLEYIHPQFIGQDLLIHMAVNSPWGNYDVDESEGGITLTVEGIDSPQPYRVTFEQRHHEHGFHFEPVAVTYQWDYERVVSEQCAFDMTVAIWNDQRTAQSTGAARFDTCTYTAIDSDGNAVAQEHVGEVESPGASLTVLVLGLAALALLVRRR